jgi:RecA-family ATPase
MPITIVPQAPQAERAVVACLLIEPHQSSKVIATKGFKGDDLFDPHLKLIFDAAFEDIKKGQVPEYVSLATRLAPKGIKHTELTDLWSSLASTIPLPDWCDLVVDAAKRRRLIEVLRETEQLLIQETETDSVLTFTSSAFETLKAKNGTDSIFECPILDLINYNTDDDPNTLLGNRWICKGGSIVFNAQSGVGKSSLNMQLAIGWALADRWEHSQALTFGIKAVRPMRQVIIQAENDIGDQAEVLQSLLLKLGKTWVGEAELADLSERLFFYRDNIHAGAEFLQIVEALVNKHSPDICWIDPLMCYLGDDITDQAVVTQFCNGLNRISSRTGVVFALIHHQPKPREGGSRTESDLAYAGFGSSALTNWAREVVALNRVPAPEGDPPTFSLTMTKRRMRAGLRNTDGYPSSQIFIRHFKSRIDPNKGEKPIQIWIECPAPKIEEDEEPKKKKKWNQDR